MSERKRTNQPIDDTNDFEENANTCAPAPLSPALSRQPSAVEGFAAVALVDAIGTVATVKAVEAVAAEEVDGVRISIRFTNESAEQSMDQQNQQRLTRDEMLLLPEVEAMATVVAVARNEGTSAAGSRSSSRNQARETANNNESIGSSNNKNNNNARSRSNSISLTMNQSPSHRPIQNTDARYRSPVQNKLPQSTPVGSRSATPLTAAGEAGIALADGGIALGGSRNLTPSQQRSASAQKKAADAEKKLRNALIESGAMVESSLSVAGQPLQPQQQQSVGHSGRIPGKSGSNSGNIRPDSASRVRYSTAAGGGGGGGSRPSSRKKLREWENRNVVGMKSLLLVSKVERDGRYSSKKSSAPTTASAGAAMMNALLDQMLHNPRGKNGRNGGDSGKTLNSGSRKRGAKSGPSFNEHQDKIAMHALLQKMSADCANYDDYSPNKDEFCGNAFMWGGAVLWRNKVSSLFDKENRNVLETFRNCSEGDSKSKGAKDNRAIRGDDDRDRMVESTAWEEASAAWRKVDKKLRASAIDCVARSLNCTATSDSKSVNAVIAPQGGGEHKIAGCGDQKNTTTTNNNNNNNNNINNQHTSSSDSGHNDFDTAGIGLQSTQRFFENLESLLLQIIQDGSYVHIEAGSDINTTTTIAAETEINPVSVSDALAAASTHPAAHHACGTDDNDAPAAAAPHVPPTMASMGLFSAGLTNCLSGTPLYYADVDSLALPFPHSASYLRMLAHALCRFYGLTSKSVDVKVPYSASSSKQPHHEAPGRGLDTGGRGKGMKGSRVDEKTKLMMISFKGARNRGFSAVAREQISLVGYLTAAYFLSTSTSNSTSSSAVSASHSRVLTGGDSMLERNRDRVSCNDDAAAVESYGGLVAPTLLGAGFDASTSYAAADGNHENEEFLVIDYEDVVPG